MHKRRPDIWINSDSENQFQIIWARFELIGDAVNYSTQRLSE